MSKSSPEKGIYYGWNILAITFLILFIGLSFRQSFNVFFKPIQEEFEISRAALSLPVSISLILFGVAQPLGGILISRFSSRKIITFGVMLTGLAVFGMSRINSFGEIYLYYGLLLGLGGIGNSFPAVTPLLSSWFQERRGLALSIASTGSSLGQLIVLPSLSLSLGAFGWRTTFWGVGILILMVILPLCAIVIRNHPGDIRIFSTNGEPPSSERATLRSVPYEFPWVQCLEVIS